MRDEIAAMYELCDDPRLSDKIHADQIDAISEDEWTQIYIAAHVERVNNESPGTVWYGILQGVEELAKEAVGETIVQ